MKVIGSRDLLEAWSEALLVPASAERSVRSKAYSGCRIAPGAIAVAIATATDTSTAIAS
ncbi:MAG: hypothetical protein V7634_1266 [Bradyrhizobium sp.]